MQKNKHSAVEKMKSDIIKILNSSDKQDANDRIASQLLYAFQSHIDQYARSNLSVGCQRCVLPQSRNDSLSSLLPKVINII